MVWVSNAAPGLTEEQVPLLAEPFWQGDASRSSRERFGLGLALASEFAVLQGGKLSFSLKNGVLTASLSLPKNSQSQ